MRPRMFQSQLGLSHAVCSVGVGYIRCDWETILVRLRPRESTWLDTLLAVDKGCLVRTRPVCMRRDTYSQNTKEKKPTTLLCFICSYTTSHKLQRNEAQNPRSTTADEKLLMLEAAEQTSDPKLNTQIQQICTHR